MIGDMKVNSERPNFWKLQIENCQNGKHCLLRLLYLIGVEFLEMVMLFCRNHGKWIVVRPPRWSLIG